MAGLIQRRKAGGKRRKKRWKRRRMLAGIAAVFAVMFFSALFHSPGVWKPKREKHPSQHARNVSKETTTPAACVETPMQSKNPATPQPSQKAADAKKETDGIYTYLQGPKSWKQGRPWSGEWGEAYMDGGSFGGFGCGLCCMANVYSSLSGKYVCSPIDMYRYAKKHTGYTGGMAIGWGDMKRGLASVGFTCETAEKPDSYPAFQKEMKTSLCSIVLVSSAASTVYWKDTPGHYVTVFTYDAAQDRVFLADSGDPAHNRQWISLKKIYRSLKTESNRQYLIVRKYTAGRDQWKHRSTTGQWHRPEIISGH